jgi:hypothetical protein
MGEGLGGSERRHGNARKPAARTHDIAGGSVLGSIILSRPHHGGGDALKIFE